MMAMQVKISASGNEQLAAWREGTHDDLVFAVALAYWNANKVFPGGPPGNSRWWTNECVEDTERLFGKWKREQDWLLGM